MLDSPFKTPSETNTSKSEVSAIFETDGFPLVESVTEHSDKDSDSYLISYPSRTPPVNQMLMEIVKNWMMELGVIMLRWPMWTTLLLVNRNSHLPMAMLANTETLSHHETELYDSGALRHMSPTAINSSISSALNRKPSEQQTAKSSKQWTSDMHIKLPNGQTMSQILLKNVLYVPTMDLPWSQLARSLKPGLQQFFIKISWRLSTMRHHSGGHWCP